MAKTEIGASVNVEFQSIGQMRKAIKEATSDLIAMSEKFGASSTEATNAAKRVAALKDSLGDAKALADTFNPDKKFVALGGAIQGAVSGFSALQGAMGLFGNESKDLEKVLLKVQSAMALQQGISGIAGAMDSMKMFAGIIKNQVVAAFTTLRGAMSAVGIGLLTSAIAYLIENFDKVKAAIYDTFPALKGLFDNMDRIKQIAMGVGNAIMQFLAAPISAIVKVIQGDFSGAMDALKQGVSFTKNFREGEQKEIKAQADEREKARQEELKKQKEANDKKLEEQKRAAAELKKERENAEREYTKFIESENERRAKLRMDDFDKQKLDIEKRYAEQLAIAKKYGFDTSEIERLRFQDSKDLINKTSEENRKGLELFTNNFSETVPKIATAQSSITVNQQTEAKIRKQINDDEIASETEKLNFKKAATDQIISLFGAETDFGRAALIVKQVLAAQEMLMEAKKTIFFGKSALAKSTVAVAEGSAQTAKIGFPQNIPLLIGYAVQAAGIIMAIRQAVKGMGSATAGAGAPDMGGMPSISSSAPVSAALPATATAQMVNAQAINQMGNQAARAYVLNSDIQNNDQRNAYLQRNARLG